MEGYGDVAAVPQLLGRTGAFLGLPIACKNPIRAGEWKRLRANGVLEKYLSLAASRECDQILLLLDLEDECCAVEYASALERIQAWDNGREIEVGVAFFVREYESLFLACADDIDSAIAGGVPNPESFRDAKGRLRQVLGRRYKETQDQLAFTKMLDLANLTTRSRSYRKLLHEITGSDYGAIEALGK